MQPNFDSLNNARINSSCVRFYPTLNQIWVAVSTGSNTTNDSIFVYDYIYNAWQSTIPDRAASVLCASIDSRTAPHHPVVIVSGDYGGFVYEHDYGNSNVQSGGPYTGSGTVCVPLGTNPSDFIPRSIRVVCDGQPTGQIQVGWGFNDIVALNNTTTFSDVQVSYNLDQNFFLDSSTLSGNTLIFKVISTPNNARTYTVQVQFLNGNNNQLFSVHPFYISDELVS
jgi:hypothetical protein